MARTNARSAARASQPPVDLIRIPLPARISGRFPPDFPDSTFSEDGRHRTALATLLHDGPLRDVVWLKAPADCTIMDAQVLEGGDVVVGQRCCGREPGDCRAQVVRLAANGETRWIRQLEGKTNQVFLAVDDEHRINVVWTPQDEDCEFSTGRDTLACHQRRQTSWVRLDLDGASAVADPAVARPAGTR